MGKFEVVVADLDGTLIETLSGKSFPEGIYDMRIRFGVLNAIRALEPKCLVIVTNQGGISAGYVDEGAFKTKLAYIQQAVSTFLGIPVFTKYCSSMDKDNAWRKPNIGMLVSALHDMIVARVVDSSFSFSKSTVLMVGDASGLEGQFSDSDKVFAERAGASYIDVGDLLCG